MAETRNWVQDTQKDIAGGVANNLTATHKRHHPVYLNEEARYVVGDSKSDDPDMSGIYFIDRKITRIPVTESLHLRAEGEAKPDSWIRRLRDYFHI